jgi:ADP-heptose:LPS heptosyltransferase
MRLLQQILGHLARRGAPARKGKAARPPRKILLIQTGGLRELICSLPLRRSLELKFPRAHIDWLISPACKAVIPFASARGKIVSLPRKQATYRLPSAQLQELQQQDYDWSIALSGRYDPRLAWLSLAIGARERAGHVAASRTLLGFGYTRPAACPPPDRHLVEKHIDLIRHFNLAELSNDTHLETTSDARERIRFHWSASGLAIGQPAVIFHMTSSPRQAIRWPVRNFIALGQRLLQNGVAVRLNAMPWNRADADAIQNALGSEARVFCWTDMSDYLAFLETAKAVIGPEGGGMHLAAAVGTHTLALHSQTDPATTRPWTGEHIQLYKANQPLRAFTADEVWNKLIESRWLGGISY